MKFERLKQTDRIEITDNRNSTLRTIRDRAEIEPIVTFALHHANGWATPSMGTPVALVGANFYAGNKFLGILGVGSTFLTAQGCGGFQSRSVPGADRKVIMDLFAVKDPYTEKQPNP